MTAQIRKITCKCFSHHYPLRNNPSHVIFLYQLGVFEMDKAKGEEIIDRRSINDIEVTGIIQNHGFKLNTQFRSEVTQNADGLLIRLVKKKGDRVTLGFLTISVESSKRSKHYCFQ